ncbi:hypothetical protein BCL93_10524 [Onishia taeanensis]|uniref:Uncharacterized protein n=1 Tax=Onishia taeanensis TaxID=284577 RepID=A0A328XVW1_9GAMM|nr:DUF6586 family protein [Halomonas taeanensis]RAR61427.1 hypothetical protein BCL93_10524 [Halomonas taeanensis]
MTPSGRTNQLLYQAELLLAVPAGDDEHAVSRRMAVEEGALALLELALNSALRELTEHARLPRHDWRELLVTDARPVAELTQLAELATQPDSWLAWLLSRLETLHGVDGAARREEANPMTIAVAGQRLLGEELSGCLVEFKTTLARLRETSVEW